MMKKKTLMLAALAVIFLATSALAGVVWGKTRPAKSYADMDAFSAEWLVCPEEDRHEMLDWLLGQEPARHTIYPVGQTRLAGLSRNDVIQYLGTPKGVGNHYFVGSIENDLLGNLIVPKRDHLSIHYDANGIIESIKTIS